MFKKAALIIIVFAITVPTAQASYRWGVGAYLNGLISGGLEVKYYIPIAEESSVFLAPHGFAFMTEYDFSYSVGVRTGVVFKQNSWISPYVGLSAGTTGGDIAWHPVVGVRGFAGVSVSPFRALRFNSADKQDIFKIDLDVALSSRWRNYTGAYEHEWLSFPGLALGFSFNW